MSADLVQVAHDLRAAVLATGGAAVVTAWAGAVLALAYAACRGAAK